MEEKSKDISKKTVVTTATKPDLPPKPESKPTVPKAKTESPDVAKASPMLDSGKKSDKIERVKHSSDEIEAQAMLKANPPLESDDTVPATKPKSDLSE